MAVRAFSTLGCPALTLDEVLDLAGRPGISAVEVRALSGSLDLPAVFAADYLTPDQLARHVGVNPVRVVSLGTSVRLMSPREDDRAALLALAPWAEALGARSLRVFDGGERADAGELTHAHTLLDWWRGQRNASGWTVDLIVETHDALAHPDALRRFVDEVPEAALLWDAHHTWKKGGQPPAITWPVVAARTAHIHVKDSLPEPGPRLPYRYVTPGTGDFPMDELRAALDSSGYDGVLSLEWERLWHPELPPLEVALDAAAGWW